jgi:DNA damage-binding protein 1
MSTEMAHYVVTAHPPGAVQCVAKGNFLHNNCNSTSNSSGDAQQVVAIAKSRKLEFRACTDGETPFPLLLSLTIHGRITNMIPLPLRTATSTATTSSTNPALLFVMTQDFQYAVLGSPADPSIATTARTTTPTIMTSTPSTSGVNIQTIDSGKIRPTLLGHKPMEGAPIITLSTDGHQLQNRSCLAMHLYDGFLTFLPIHTQNYYVQRRNNNAKMGESSQGDQQVPGPTGKSENSTTTATTTVANNKSSTGGSSRSTLALPLLGEPFHLRVEEHNILDLAFLHANPATTATQTQPQQQLAILHQDSRGLQHVVVYSLDIKTRQLSLLWKKQRLDGGSSTLIAVPPTSTVAAAAAATSESISSTASQAVMAGGSLVVLGQRQITLLGQSPATTQVVPLPTCLILSYCPLPPSAAAGHARYLLGDEFGNLHMLTVGPQSLTLDTLGSTTVLTSGMVYMDPGWVFCGSKLGDSQLLQIHPEPITQDNDDDDNNNRVSSYLSVLEEYTNLGPIVDIDVCGHQSSSSPGGVVTASGTSVSGSLRLVRNGIGMKEFAAVELPGIQNMWAIRAHWADQYDSYLIQAYVAETRILGVVSSGKHGDDEEENHDDGEAGNTSGDVTLDEVVLVGLDSTATSLYVGNVQEGDFVLQITATEIRVLRTAENFVCTHTWTPDEGGTIAVASANEAGQIVIALRGGHLVYLQAVNSGSLKVVGKMEMSSEVSCLNLNPFATSTSMETDCRADAELSAIFTVGLWDDLTVRLLTLDETMTEVLQIHLSTEDEVESAETDGGLASQVRRNRNNMMARSLCLVTLDSTSTNGSDGGVDMLFVGLGDGTLISFVVDQQDGTVAVRSKKEVSLGTQRITLIPLQTERGGTCVLATGDRPTVIYLAGGGSRNLTPKLCYSNVNLSTDEADDEGAMPPAESITVNVATPFVSPQLFDDSSLSSKHYSLCVSDDSVLRLGVIDDIQKLHVTTCRLGMAPRRVVHCPEGRLFAVGCIESGIQQVGTISDDVRMGNCIRFLDDTTFDDIER